jgi:four helix bundle protein
VKENNLILDKSFDFALKIIELYKKLTEQKEYILSKKLLRSGTSIGANAEEAIGAHSRKDFLAKLIIAHKEVGETRYWLRLLDRSQLVKLDYSNELKHTDEIINILTAIIKTTKKNSLVLNFIAFTIIPISFYIFAKQLFLTNL